MKLFEDNPFDNVTHQLPEVTDYFDFPSSLMAFGESLSSSHLFVVPPGVFFRKRNQQHTLITYFCSSEELKTAIGTLKSSGAVVKSLNFVNKDMSAFKQLRYMDEFWINQEWSIELILAGYNQKKRYNIRRDLRLAEDKYMVIPNESKTSFKYTTAMDLFEDWYSFAKNRHFMVMRGHYIKYIENYFTQPNNVQFLSFRRKDDEQLFGMAGFEVFKNKAQLTIMKHRGGDYSFPRFFWVRTLEFILHTQGVEKVFCGSTADSLKEALGFNKEKSYKLEI